ncbi:hypothetical protein ACFPLB_08500 [Aquamicrobium segne]|uniref:Uncharacterized protein n=1 Tax=Aquamicrobium segne TaxID=469547 RepID=A0ABW0H032_9HYPH
MRRTASEKYEKDQRNKGLIIFQERLGQVDHYFVCFSGFAPKPTSEEYTGRAARGKNRVAVFQVKIKV